MLYTDPESEISLSAQTETIATDMRSAWQLRSRSRPIEAVQACQAVLAVHPGCGEAWHLLGVLAYDQGNLGLAEKQLMQAIAVEPGQALHYNNLGVVLNSNGQYQQAACFLRKALEISPDYQDAGCNLGLALFRQGQLSRAALCFEKVLSADPQNDAALANLGMTRLAQQNYPEAAASYEKAIRINPGQPVWHANLGTAYLRLAQFDRAAACYRQASLLDPSNLKHFVSQGIALRAAGQLPESIQILERALSMDPSLSPAIANIVTGLEYACQWDKLELFHPLLTQATQMALKNDQLPDEDPMLNIRRCDDISLNQAVSRAWSLDIQRKAQRIDMRFSHSKNTGGQGPISIGYLSYDFRNHPVAHQLFPLFRLHDRSRFRVVAFSMGPDDGSTFRREIMAGCDEFINMADCELAEAAQLIYENRIDILVDLMGHSHHNRLEILALRPAPLQVGYLGFLATTGADFIDYLVADPVVVPDEHNPYYDEKLLRLPHCYQLNHSRLTQGRDHRTHRQDWGLPPRGFVFCCFNSAYKIDRTLFDAWMCILHKTPGAVLWLNGGHAMASAHMRVRAETLGVDPGRLVFAEKLPLEKHLNRLPLADLALDTIRYNGGATTANALGVGLPVITVMGRHWVSRMTASHLIAAGLPDLIFNSLKSYEQAAIEMAGHPELLFAIRQKLAQNTKTHPLFNARGFVRDLEAGFESIWQRHLNGLKPDHIHIHKDSSRISAHE